MKVPTVTKKQLAQMSDEELGKLQRSLGQFLDTPQEKEAKLLNQAIRDERDRRSPYGF